MIEVRFLPGALLMTTRTLGAQATLVGLVCFVTVHTLRGRLTVLSPGLVACGAGDLYMGTKQCELGASVVERIRIQPHDVGVTTLVIRVAMLAVCG